MLSKSKHLYTLQNNTYKLDLRNKAESNCRFVSDMRIIEPILRCVQHVECGQAAELLR